MEKKNLKEYGTTLVRIKFKEGIIIGADKQVSGNFILSDNIDKLYQVGGAIIGTTGRVAHCTEILQYAKMLRKEKALYEKVVGLSDLTNYIARILGNNNFYAGFILRGFDDKGIARIYGMDSGGGFEDYSQHAMGSGSVFALPILDKGYSPNLSESEAKKTVIRALEASIKRDFYSGGTTIDLAIITKNKISPIMNIALKKKK
jgi:20S proteasome subunit beta 2